MLGALRSRPARLGRCAARRSLGTLVDDRGRLRREELGQQLGFLAVDRSVHSGLGERGRLSRVLALDEDMAGEGAGLLQVTQPTHRNDGHVEVRLVRVSVSVRVGERVRVSVRP